MMKLRFEPDLDFQSQLGRSKVIDDLTGLQVRSPARIIVEIYDRMAGLRKTDRISGPDFGWQHNVYYRSAGTSRNLKPPARILWYVSEDGSIADSSQIAGSSHLDCVEVDPAKDIFRKHQKRGTLDRKSVVQIAKGDPEGEVMASEIPSCFFSSWYLNILIFICFPIFSWIAISRTTQR